MKQMAVDKTQYRISGHESFSCRYAWLPKVIHLVQHDSNLLLDVDNAMVELGLGKNMVRSARFWALATSIIEPTHGKVEISEFGNLLLGKKGLDPYFEDILTLWLLHWKLSTNVDNPLLAWDYLLNRFHDPEIIPSSTIELLHKEAQKHNLDISLNSIRRHFDVFIRTYVQTRGKKGKVQEDNLDCPLIELELLLKVGEKESLGETREPVYAYRRDEKLEITNELFSYCLLDYWNKKHKSEITISLRDIAHGYGSPGQIFKIPEENIRKRLEVVSSTTFNSISYNESSQAPQVQKMVDVSLNRLLRSIYRKRTLYVV